MALSWTDALKIVVMFWIVSLAVSLTVGLFVVSRGLVLVVPLAVAAWYWYKENRKMTAHTRGR